MLTAKLYYCRNCGRHYKMTPSKESMPGYCSKPCRMEKAVRLGYKKPGYTIRSFGDKLEEENKIDYILESNNMKANILVSDL